MAAPFSKLARNSVGPGHEAVNPRITRHEFASDLEALQDVALRFQNTGVVASLARLGVFAGYGDHEINLA